eukprot:UN16434
MCKIKDKKKRCRWNLCRRTHFGIQCQPWREFSIHKTWAIRKCKGTKKGKACVNMHCHRHKNGRIHCKMIRFKKNGKPLP